MFQSIILSLLEQIYFYLIYICLWQGSEINNIGHLFGTVIGSLFVYDSLLPTKSIMRTLPKSITGKKKTIGTRGTKSQYSVVHRLRSEIKLTAPVENISSGWKKMNRKQ